MLICSTDPQAGKRQANHAVFDIQLGGADNLMGKSMTRRLPPASRQQTTAGRPSRFRRIRSPAAGVPDAFEQSGASQLIFGFSGWQSRVCRTLLMSSEPQPRVRFLPAVILVGALLLVGCTSAVRESISQAVSQEYYPFHERAVTHYKQVATQIEYPDVHTKSLAEATKPLPPRTVADFQVTNYFDLTLDEAIRLALSNSRVMRSLDGRVLRNPASIATVYDPSIQESDPRFGVEGALSAFDAQFSTSVFWEYNDRPVNSLDAVGAVGAGMPFLFRQDLAFFTAEISKTNATGGTWSVRNNTNYEYNNRTTNIAFPSVWETNVEAEFRQPLLQGAGIDFNRIAGPGAQPGFTNGFFFSNGVLIARTNHDIALADFEAGVRNLVSDVENAYWDLYFAYRDLDAKIRARDAALQTLSRLEALEADAASLAQAQVQYLTFRGEVENALSGVPGGSTVGGGGSSAGTFRGAGGLYAREADLRLLLGLADNDGRLIRPVDEPSTVRIHFAFEEILAEALCRRVELRRQRWLIKRRELEYIASQNFLYPRLDAIALYRWRGFGDDLLDPSGDNPPFDNAFEELTGGDFQEWRLGLEFSVPIGRRQAHAAVRNAELALTRAKAVHQDQELNVAHDLAAAIRELERAYQAIRTNHNIRITALRRLEALEERAELDGIGQSTLQGAELASRRAFQLDQRLEAQRSVAQAETAYYRSVLEYNLAVKAVHFEKGSLLDYNGVLLVEGGWPKKAYLDAKKRARRRAVAQKLDYGFTLPAAISRGLYVQQTEAGERMITSVLTPAPHAVTTPPPENQDPAEDDPDSAEQSLEPTDEAPSPTNEPETEQESLPEEEFVRQPTPTALSSGQLTPSQAAALQVAASLAAPAQSSSAQDPPIAGQRADSAVPQDIEPGAVTAVQFPVAEGPNKVDLSYILQPRRQAAPQARRETPRSSEPIARLPRAEQPAGRLPSGRSISGQPPSGQADAGRVVPAAATVPQRSRPPEIRPPEIRPPEKRSLLSWPQTDQGGRGQQPAQANSAELPPAPLPESLPQGASALPRSTQQGQPASTAGQDDSKVVWPEPLPVSNPFISSMPSSDGWSATDAGDQQPSPSPQVEKADQR